ncbi:alanine transaminase [Malassezia psittaci]|uniref:Glutamate pyruvate transaminase n=1 Tax=Malassezia psittaci TaxID=1821823 RepID=A0AAF0FBR1_9BASI|nr:alanine transaminase [Malassezia psittaci]
MPSRGKTLTKTSINPNVLNVEYAVRGGIPAVAAKYQDELDKGKKLAFDSIVWTNIGNPQQLPNLAQPPLSFWRQVAALTEYPSLLDSPKETRDALFPIDAQQRAQELLKAFGSVGAYTGSKGVALIRQHVAEFVEERDGYPEDIENIYLSTGASGGILTLFQTFFRPGQDAILIPIPQYPLYSAAVSLYDLTAAHYQLDPNKNWEASLDSVHDSLRKARKEGKTPRAIVVINPGNPTGSCMSRAEIEAIIKIAYEEELVIFADEVYQRNVYQSEHPFISFRKVLLDFGNSSKEDERKISETVELVSSHSISKGFSGECGRRGGYYQLTNIDSDVEAQVNKLVSVSLCPPVQGQIGVDMLVKPPKEGEPSYELYAKEVDEIRSTLEHRSDLIAKRLDSLDGIHIRPAMGALYLFPQLHLSKKAWDQAKADNKKVDELYCLELLDKTGICVVPGAGFGEEPVQLEDGSCHAYFRTTMLAKATDEFVDRFVDFHKGFMERY